MIIQQIRNDQQIIFRKAFERRRQMRFPQHPELEKFFRDIDYLDVKSIEARICFLPSDAPAKTSTGLPKRRQTNT